MALSRPECWRGTVGVADLPQGGGMPYAQIAELMGKSVDAVEKRHLREIERHPALGELFPVKVRKQRARKGTKV